MSTSRRRFLQSSAFAAAAVSVAALAADDRMRSLRKLDRLQEIARRIVQGVDEAYEVVQTAKQDDVVVKHRHAVLRLPQRIVTYMRRCR